MNNNLPHSPGAVHCACLCAVAQKRLRLGPLGQLRQNNSKGRFAMVRTAGYPGNLPGYSI